MKFSFATICLFATLVVAGPISKRQITNQCSRVNIRQNIADLTPGQRDAFFNAVQALKDTPDPVVPNCSIYDKYVKMHMDYVKEGHGNAQHAPWHRLFIHQFEQDLQKVDPSVVLPYWDWSVSSQSPERSIVFTNDYVGGNGDRNTGCVTTGRFANWQIRFPQRGCLERRFDGGNRIGAFSAPEILNKMIYESRSFEDFATTLEYGIHSRVHNGVGGTMAQMWSNSDPVFYLHHANTDRLWSMYQSRGDGQANEYNGKRPDGGAANLDDVLVPFGKTVREAMDMVNGLCYSYTKQDIPTPVTTLTPTTVPTTTVPVTNTTTPTPEVVPTVVPTVAPMLAATSTPTQTVVPTTEVTATLTPSPEVTPTPSPEVIPTAAPTPSPEITPIVTTTPSPAATEVTTIPTETVQPTSIPDSPQPTQPTQPTFTPVTTPPQPTSVPITPPKPASVPFTPPKTTPSRNTYVSAYDRTNMRQIRLPVKVPISWLLMHHMSLQVFARLYDTLARDVQEYNTRYVDSVSSLQYYTNRPTTDKLPEVVYSARGIPVPNSDNLYLTLPIGKVRVLSAKGMTVTDASGTVPASSVDPKNLPIAVDLKTQSSSAPPAPSSARSSSIGQLAVVMVAALLYLA